MEPTGIQWTWHQAAWAAEDTSYLLRWNQVYGVWHGLSSTLRQRPGAWKGSLGQWLLRQELAELSCDYKGYYRFAR